MKTQALSRLQGHTQVAFQKNSSGKNSFSSNLVFVGTELHAIACNDPAKVKAIGGSGNNRFWFNQSLSAVVASTIDWPTPVGLITLEKLTDHSMWNVGISVVHPNFQGRGIGLGMYGAVINHFGALASDSSLSKSSSAVWEALSKRFRVEYMIPKDASPINKKMSVKIVGWTREGGASWPVFKLDDGRQVSLRELHKLKLDQDGESKEAAKDGWLVAYAK